MPTKAENFVKKPAPVFEIINFLMFSLKVDFGGTPE